MSFHAEKTSGGILIFFGFPVLGCHLIKIDGHFLPQCNFPALLVLFFLTLEKSQFHKEMRCLHVINV